MGFDEWNDKHWTITYENGLYVLNAPGMKYLFTEHDFMDLQKKINNINIFNDNKIWFSKEDKLINRETGEELTNKKEVCYKLNEYEEELKNDYNFKEDVFSNTIRQGVVLQGKYDNLKKEYDELIKENKMLIKNNNRLLDAINNQIMDEIYKE